MGNQGVSERGLDEPWLLVAHRAKRTKLIFLYV